MRVLYKAFRRFGLNATRALIGTRMLSGRRLRDGRVIAYVAQGLRGWSDHMCRTFVRGGYAWPKD